jgi:hypothetical protein
MAQKSDTALLASVVPGELRKWRLKHRAAAESLEEPRSIDGRGTWSRPSFAKPPAALDGVHVG